MSKMDKEEKTLYIEYRKIGLDNSRYKDALKISNCIFHG